MITLNTDNGLQKIDSWDDIESIPGFVKNIDPAKHKLVSIVGRYILKEKVRCGLSNCHSPHAKGYLVATTDGHKTNIGKDCGSREFGVEFESLSKKFERDISQKEYRDTLWSFRYQLDDVEKRLAELRRSKNGADWVHKQARPLAHQNCGCPDVIVKMIDSMVKTRSNVIVLQRKATNNEVDDIEAIENRTLLRPHYITEPIAELIGIEALYPENDLRKLLVLDLDTNIKHIKEADIDTLSYEELKHWARWVGGVENTLEKAVEIITMGRKLLDVTNLSPFLKVLDRHEDEKLFRRYLRGLHEN